MNVAAHVTCAACALALCAMPGCTRVGTGAPGGAHPWTRHGVLRMVNLGEPDNLNPLVGNQQIDSDLSMLWGGYFFNVDDRNAFVPELATEVPSHANGGVSRDGRTVLYHLRRGVLWQDGKPFTAADVVFTWRAVMNPRNNVASRVGYDRITRIDRIDPWTIAVHLRSPYAPFVATFFTMSANPYPVLPAHVLSRLPDLNQASYNAQPLGTGPFIVDRWQRGQKIVFRANPHYWRGPPKLQRIEYTAIADENTLLTQVQSHEADLWFNAPSPVYPVLQRVPDLAVRLTPFVGFTQLVLNMAHPALSDVRVRRALAYATDVDRLIADVTHGVHIRGDSDQPSFLWAHAAGLPKYEYDPGKARALLDAAGWHAGSDGIRRRNGQRLTLILSSQTGSASANATEVLVQRQWHDAGVDAVLKNYVSSVFFASYGAGGIAQTGKFDVAIFAWYNGVDPDDSVEFMCDQVPPAGQNLYHLCDPAIDAAERSALQNYDSATRKRAYDDIQRRLAADEPFILLWFVRRIDVWNPDLRNFRPAHVVTDFWNPWDWQI